MQPLWNVHVYVVIKATFSASFLILSTFSSLTGVSISDQSSFSTPPTPPALLYHSKRSVTVFTKSIAFKWTRYALDFLDLSSCARKLAKGNNLFLAPSDCNKQSIIILYIYIITPVHVESYFLIPSVYLISKSWYLLSDNLRETAWINFTPHSFMFKDASHRHHI